MTRLEKLYEGKAKIVYSTDDPDVYIQDFKDSATAFDGTKKGTILAKGQTNNAISARLFTLLGESGVRTHFQGLESEPAMTNPIGPRPTPVTEVLELPGARVHAAPPSALSIVTVDMYSPVVASSGAPE